MLARLSWQQVSRNGIPPLVAIRRALQFGDRTFAVGEVLTGLPDKRLRQFYEQRKAAPAPQPPVAEGSASSLPAPTGSRKPKQKGE